MKAAPFDYALAGSLEEVTDALHEGGDDAMVIAGGQTLVPMMAMRLARPSILVDINEIAALSGIAVGEDVLNIQTCTRQCDALDDAMVAEHTPLLAKALPLIGHSQTRNRGTVGGSIAHGDPAAEIPLIAVALEAQISLQSKDGARDVGAEAFFEGPMMTAREAGECLTAVRFPVWNGGNRVGVGFREVSERHGDFAIIAAAVQLQIDASGNCTRAAVAVGGAGGVPVKIATAEATMTGNAVDEELAKSVAATVDEFIDPYDDSHASAGYRRRVARELVTRVILEAAADARGGA